MDGKMVTRPMSSHNDWLKEAAVVMTWGKLVAPGKAPPNLVQGPTLDRPWRASDHHSYPWIPSLGTEMALFTSNLIFSCNVSRPIKSLARTCIGSDALQNRRLLVIPFRGSHANGAREDSTTVAKRRSVTKIEKCLMKLQIFELDIVFWLRECTYAVVFLVCGMCCR